jgi:hypothetical protein
MLAYTSFRRAGDTLTHEFEVNIIKVLKATLIILENVEFPTMRSKATADLKKCLIGAIAEIESVGHQEPAA